jgi:molecular chaperone GrpE (heat shock protein)
MSDEHPPTDGGTDPGKERRGDEDAPGFSVVDRRPRYDDAGNAVLEETPREPTVVQELRARVDEAERRAREISAAYRRIDEERDAFRERLSRDLERRLDIARADFMRRIVPVLDDLDRALAAARAAGEGGRLAAGVALVRERLKQALVAEGVEEIATEGKPFDPAVAEAVATEETDDPARDGVVVEEMERGWILRGAPLRPARVRVARRRPTGADL